MHTMLQEKQQMLFERHPMLQEKQQMLFEIHLMMKEKHKVGGVCGQNLWNGGSTAVHSIVELQSHHCNQSH